MELLRCSWAGTDPLYVKYHDTEWGVPTRDEREMFELLVLEGAQAGLSWITVLRKRPAYREAFDNFDAAKVALYNEADIARLLDNAGIIRNRAKVRSAINNAQRYLEVQREFSSFTHYIWDFVGNKPIINHFEHDHDIPASTPLAETISANLKQRGFNFVGPTIIYAHLQSAGLVNDHVVSCFRHPDNQTA